MERQHAKGKMTARERIDRLLDPDSFTELDEHARHRATDFGVEANRPYGDGVVTGFGTVTAGRCACTARTSPCSAARWARCTGRSRQDDGATRMQAGCPLIGMNDGGGARIQEGVVALAAYGEMFYRNVIWPPA